MSTASYRSRQFVTEFRWTFLGLIVVVVGVVSIFVVIPTWVLLVEAVLSVLLISVEVRKNVREARRFKFLPRPHEDFEDVVAHVEGSADFRVLTTGAGTFVHDRRASERMRSAEQQVRLGQPYTVPAQLQPTAKRFLKHVLRTRSGRFNGPVLGWNTNFADPAWSGDIEVVAGDHYRFVQSDELSTWDVEVDGKVLPDFGRALFIRRDGVLRDFRDSWLLNLIGASTLAITSDGRLVGTQQSEHNLASPRLLAPSGSGGVEPKDFKGESRLSPAQLAINAATRELNEETGIGYDEMERSYLLGFGRWLNMAGRGELLCVTFLNIDSHTADQRQVKNGEKTYTARTDSMRFARCVADWHPARPAEMLPKVHRPRMSVPLGAALSLLAEESALAGSPVREHLLKLPIGP